MRGCPTKIHQYRREKLRSSQKTQLHLSRLRPKKTQKCENMNKKTCENSVPLLDIMKQMKSEWYAVGLTEKVRPHIVLAD